MNLEISHYTPEQIKSPCLRDRVQDFSKISNFNICVHIYVNSKDIYILLYGHLVSVNK